MELEWFWWCAGIDICRVVSAGFVMDVNKNYSEAKNENKNWKFLF
jgi:hypothetical protein